MASSRFASGVDIAASSSIHYVFRDTKNQERERKVDSLFIEMSSPRRPMDCRGFRSYEFMGNKAICTAFGLRKRVIA